MITQEELKSWLSYDLLTGKFHWARSPCLARKTGHEAGSPSSDGYYQIKFRGTFYKSHRLAWLYVLGRMPELEVDHINGDRGDNRWINLRSASRSQNACNSSTKVTNSLGVRNVFRRGNIFVVDVVGESGRYREQFPTLEQATDMAIRMRRILQGDFAK